MKQLIIVFCAIFATSVAKSDSGMVMSFTNGVIVVVGDSNDSVFGDAARWSLFVTNSASSMALVRAVLRPSQISYNGEKVQGYTAASFEVSVPSQAATNLVYNIPFDSYMPWNDGSVCFQSFLRVESGSEQKFNIFRSGLRMPANLITANYIMDGEGDNGRLESVLSYELPIDSTDLIVRLEANRNILVEKSYAYKPRGARVVVTNSTAVPAPGSYAVKGQIVAQDYSFFIPGTNVVIRSLSD